MKKTDPILLLDGAMGTMLQKAGLKPGQKPEVFGMQNPEVVLNIHNKYIEAGSGVIYSNTFGVNRRKYEGSPFSVPDVIKANVETAKRAAGSSTEREVKVALDVGPIGELMEPLGTLSFDDAYQCFQEIVIAGEMAGADLVIFETMTDLNEVRAAVLAAKEHTSLPVWVTMTFEKNGRTFAGCDPEAMALTLDGLGVDAMGVNCSLGPSDLLPIVQKIRRRTRRPLIVKPNAGLPDPATGLYAMTPQRFAKEMADYPKMGIHILGGCCGTRPSFIHALSEQFARKESVPDDGAALSGSKHHGSEECDSNDQVNGVCSAGRVCDLDGNVRVIGERINPTGKKRFQQALRENDMDYVMKCAIEQTDAGADILDINVGLPGADEKALMVSVIRAVQSVTDLPLQIDSSDPEVIEAGLRTACGRVIVNSVNAEEEKCRQILPLVKKYGACVIGLALKKSGMPANAKERIENAETILRFTDEYKIRRQDVIIDCLALTISAQQEQAMETLHAVQYVSEHYGVHCTLGVSNISFGLPLRKHITISFLTQAMFCGVDLPIINPNQTEIMDAVFCFRALSGQDPSCISYIERFANRKEQAPTGAGSGSGSGFPGSGAGSGAGTGFSGSGSGAGGSAAEGSAVGNTGGDLAASGRQASDDSPERLLQKAILRGLPGDVRRYTSALIEQMNAMEIIEQILIPALDEVGEKYERQQIFLPQLINAANAASEGFEVIKSRLAGSEGTDISKGKVVLATVEGDIHDIGKNIVKVVLENYGFTVIDLGRDVPPERVLSAVTEDVKLVGLSALMTTTLPAMEKTIKVLKEAGCTCKVVVGGAVVTRQYAEQIHADYYAKDAKATVDAAREVYSQS